ncbi:MAG: HU family DNA-binding protein [Planctomycetes bacterium]|nr:HU family DNA-binding protein [Planctomycetota bacterium]
MGLTKKQIASRLADETGVSQTDARAIVQGTLDAIVDALVQDGRIELRDFGIFEVKLKKSRVGRNPISGLPMNIPPKKVVSFKPGRGLAKYIAKDGTIPAKRGKTGQVEIPEEHG